MNLTQRNSGSFITLRSLVKKQLVMPTPKWITLLHGGMLISIKFKYQVSYRYVSQNSPYYILPICTI